MSNATKDLYILYWVIGILFVLPIPMFCVLKGAIRRARFHRRVARSLTNGHAVLWIPPRSEGSGESKESESPRPCFYEIDTHIGRKSFTFTLTDMPFGCSICPRMPTQRTVDVTYALKKRQREQSPSREGPETKTVKVHLGMHKESVESVYLILLPGPIPQVVLGSHSCVYTRTK
ncbi:hypothetical protein CPB86DRAFT_60066 [Serendipita vermifera]|nr:hypothetical protein CPB86DRAFT_60066 [Serendipita vermifera]